MAGRSDEAQALLKSGARKLAEQLDREIDRLPGPDSEDHTTAERLRMIQLAAKAGREIAAMTVSAERAHKALEALRELNPGCDPEDNADMNDDEPADIEQVYADLQSRLDRLAATLERKRAAGEIHGRAAGEGGAGGAGAGCSG